MFRIRFFLFFQIPKGMFKVLGSKTIAEFIQFQIPMGIFSAFLIRSIVSSWRFKSQWEFSAHDKNETWLNDEEFQIPMGIFSTYHTLFFCATSTIVSNPNGNFQHMSDFSKTFIDRGFKSQWEDCSKSPTGMSSQ